MESVPCNLSAPEIVANFATSLHCLGLCECKTKTRIAMWMHKLLCVRLESGMSDSPGMKGERGSQIASMGQEQLLTPADVARILNVSVGWVRDHATRKQPRLPVVKLGKLLRFRPTDVEQFVEQLNLREAA